MLPVVVGLLIIGSFFALKSDAFLTPRNISNLILQMAGIATIAFGSVIVAAARGGRPLGGPAVGFAAAVMGVLSTTNGLPAIPSMVAALAVGCALRDDHRRHHHRLGVPSFVVTSERLAGLHGAGAA